MDYEVLTPPAPEQPDAIKTLFTYHPPTPEQVEQYVQIRNAGESLARVIHARVYRRRRRYSVSIGGLFMSAVREAKRRAKDELLPQEEMDLRVPRPA